METEEKNASYNQNNNEAKYQPEGHFVIEDTRTAYRPVASLTVILINQYIRSWPSKT